MKTYTIPLLPFVKDVKNKAGLKISIIPNSTP